MKSMLWPGNITRCELEDSHKQLQCLQESKLHPSTSPDLISYTQPIQPAKITLNVTGKINTGI